MSPRIADPSEVKGDGHGEELVSSPDPAARLDGHTGGRAERSVQD